MDALILDGAAIVNMVRPGAAKTFGAYAAEVFLPYITNMLRTVARLDVVWDVYTSDSLKNSAREQKGSGKRRHVSPDAVIPSNWQSFV